MIDHKRYPNLPPVAFENAEYQMKMTFTLETDKRIMSFVDTLWGFEVTGGYDQYEPLTVIGVTRSGYAKRAGIHVNDKIVRINDTYTDTLTLREAQLLIRSSGKAVRIYVTGEVDDEDDEYTVDFWFKPPRKIFHQENKWKECFPWNDRKKKVYRESNCFMVHSKAEDKFIERMLNRKDPIVVTESGENLITASEDIISARQRAAAAAAAKAAAADSNTELIAAEANATADNESYKHSASTDGKGR